MIATGCLSWWSPYHAAHHPCSMACRQTLCKSDVNQGWLASAGWCTELNAHNSTEMAAAGEGGSWSTAGRLSSRVVAGHHGVEHHPAGPDVDLAAAVLEAAKHLQTKCSQVACFLQAAAYAAHATLGRRGGKCTAAGRSLVVHHSSPQVPCTCSNQTAGHQSSAAAASSGSCKQQVLIQEVDAAEHERAVVYTSIAL